MDSNDFKLAMGRFPSGVTIVTTIGSEGKKCGFTASAFSSLSLDPPLILVCLANSADCYNSFNACDKFAINIIGKEQEELAFKFASKGVEKFDGNEFKEGENGLPILPDSVVSLECDAKDTYPAGDHAILVGEVKHIHLNNGIPSVWYEGKFRNLSI